MGTSSAGEAGAQVRRATLADVEAMVDAMEAVAGEGRWIGRELPLDRSAMAERFSRSIEEPDESLVLVAELDERRVGQLFMTHDGIGHGELGMLLLPEARSQGLGSALLTEAVAWADAHPVVHKVTLQAWPHNTPAIGLYAKYGFEIEGNLRRHWRRRSGELWDAVVMGLLVTDRT